MSYTISPGDPPKNRILSPPPPLMIGAEDPDGFRPVVDVGASVVKPDTVDSLGSFKLDCPAVGTPLPVVSPPLVVQVVIAGMVVLPGSTPFAPLILGLTGVPLSPPFRVSKTAAADERLPPLVSLLIIILDPLLRLPVAVPVPPAPPLSFFFALASILACSLFRWSSILPCRLFNTPFFMSLIQRSVVLTNLSLFQVRVSQRLKKPSLMMTIDTKNCQKTATMGLERAA